MYKHTEKLKQTDNDNGQDKTYNHIADKILPDNKAQSTPPQTPESPGGWFDLEVSYTYSAVCGTKVWAAKSG